MQQAAIGKVGLWSLELRFGDKVQGSEAAAELDELGYGALWIPGGIEPGAQADCRKQVERAATLTASVFLTMVKNLRATRITSRIPCAFRGVNSLAIPDR